MVWTVVTSGNPDFLSCFSIISRARTPLKPQELHPSCAASTLSPFALPGLTFSELFTDHELHATPQLLYLDRVAWPTVVHALLAMVIRANSLLYQCRNDSCLKPRRVIPLAGFSRAERAHKAAAIVCALRQHTAASPRGRNSTAPNLGDYGYQHRE